MKRIAHNEAEPEVVARITELLIRKGLTQKNLLEHLGLHPNNYTEWKSGRKRSYLLYIDEIATYLDISPTFLLRGKDDDPDEIELLRLYRTLDEPKRKRLLQTAAAM